MVVDIRNTKTDTRLFNCSFFSDFTDEKERLFIGGMGAFEFLSIHYLSLKEDYANFIRGINILARLLTGYPYEISLIESIDIECIELLIKNNQKTWMSVYSSQNIPTYIQSFFDNFVNNIIDIQIEMTVMNCHNEYAKYNQFGYKLLKNIFFVGIGNKSEETIDFPKILNIFNTKLQTIIIFNMPGRAFEPSIYLNELFIDRIIKGIKIINGSLALKQTFDEFLIIEPQNSISEFINKYETLFKQNGFILSKITYKHPKRNSISNETLSIKKL